MGDGGACPAKQKGRGSGREDATGTTACQRDSLRVYFTCMLGTGGSGMLGLIWNPVWGGWL